MRSDRARTRLVGKDILAPASTSTSASTRRRRLRLRRVYRSHGLHRGVRGMPAASTYAQRPTDCGQPTNLNNVETYAKRAWIINHGATSSLRSAPHQQGHKDLLSDRQSG